VAEREPSVSWQSRAPVRRRIDTLQALGGAPPYQLRVHQKWNSGTQAW
jgi:hypothetical protein